MKLLKIVTLLALAAGSVTLTSCGCCTGEEPVPPLRPLKSFNSYGSGYSGGVDYAK